MEVWKDIKGYENLYRVSNYGNVKSLFRWNGHKYIKRDKPYVLKQTNTTTGYKKVELVKDKVKKSHKVHRLVLITFVREVKGKKLTNHIDGNPINNHVNNLEWCNQSENVQHAYDTGLIPRKITKDKENRIIKLYKKGISAIYIAKEMGVEKTTVYKYLKKNNVRIEGASIRNNVYNIDKEKLIKDFKKNMRNVDIAEKHNTNRMLIGTLKYKYKKEGLI